MSCAQPRIVKIERHIKDGITDEMETPRPSIPIPHTSSASSLPQRILSVPKPTLITTQSAATLTNHSETNQPINTDANIPVSARSAPAVKLSDLNRQSIALESPHTRGYVKQYCPEMVGAVTSPQQSFRAHSLPINATEDVSALTSPNSKWGADSVASLHDVMQTLNEIRNESKPVNIDNTIDDCRNERETNEMRAFLQSRITHLCQFIVEMNSHRNDVVSYLPQITADTQQNSLINSILSIPSLQTAINQSQRLFTENQCNSDEYASIKALFTNVVSFVLDYFHKLYPSLPLPTAVGYIQSCLSKQSIIKPIPNKESQHTSAENTSEPSQNEIRSISTQIEALTSKLESVQQYSLQMQQLQMKHQLNLQSKQNEWESNKQSQSHQLHQQQSQLIQQSTKLLEAIHTMASHQTKQSTQLKTIDESTTQQHSSFDANPHQSTKLSLLKDHAHDLETVTNRIESALEKAENPQLFQSRVARLVTEANTLDQKLNTVEATVVKHTKKLESNIQSALAKFCEMHSTSDLIAAGVSPAILVEPSSQVTNKDKNGKNEAKESDEEKLSFLKQMPLSETGFDYQKKKEEIKSLMTHVLDARQELDRSVNIHPTPFRLIPKYSHFPINDSQPSADDLSKDIEKRLSRIVAITEEAASFPRDTLSVKFIENEGLIYTDGNTVVKPKRQTSLKRKPTKISANDNGKDTISVPNIPSDPPSPSNNVPTITQLTHQITSQQLQPSQPNPTQNIINPIESQSKKLKRVTTRRPPELQFSNVAPKPPPIVNKPRQSLSKPLQKIEETTAIDIDKQLLPHNSVEIEATMASLSMCDAMDANEEESVSLHESVGAESVNDLCGLMLSNLFSEQTTNHNSTEVTEQIQSNPTIEMNDEMHTSMHSESDLISSTNEALLTTSTIEYVSQLVDNCVTSVIPLPTEPKPTMQTQTIVKTAAKQSQTNMAEPTPKLVCVEVQTQTVPKTSLQKSVQSNIGLDTQCLAMTEIDSKVRDSFSLNFNTIEMAHISPNQNEKKRFQTRKKRRKKTKKSDESKETINLFEMNELQRNLVSKYGSHLMRPNLNLSSLRNGVTISITDSDLESLLSLSSSVSSLDLDHESDTNEMISVTSSLLSDGLQTDYDSISLSSSAELTLDGSFDRLRESLAKQWSIVQNAISDIK